ncbi:hypothetical protein ACM66B_003221 [Microbotryomycetes sp. NB124-2]
MARPRVPFGPVDNVPDYLAPAINVVADENAPIERRWMMCQEAQSTLLRAAHINVHGQQIDRTAMASTFKALTNFDILARQHVAPILRLDPDLPAHQGLDAIAAALEAQRQDSIRQHQEILQQFENLEERLGERLDAMGEQTQRNQATLAAHTRLLNRGTAQDANFRKYRQGQGRFVATCNDEGAALPRNLPALLSHQVIENLSEVDLKAWARYYGAPNVPRHGRMQQATRTRLLQHIYDFVFGLRWRDEPQ